MSWLREAIDSSPLIWLLTGKLDRSAWLWMMEALAVPVMVGAVSAYVTLQIAAHDITINAAIIKQEREDRIKQGEGVRELIEFERLERAMHDQEIRDQHKLIIDVLQAHSKRSAR